MFKPDATDPPPRRPDSPPKRLARWLIQGAMQSVGALPITLISAWIITRTL
ncbi:hypothetical protein ACIRQY_20705 [Streptomyces sp. NPDC101490]|uniref:hypothetical protein n=1 Tax=Streptomyces sp. NPDC101490 TaxID=3366143 RepID=UPI003807C352